MSLWNNRLSQNSNEKISEISALESEKWSNHKIKALYNVLQGPKKGLTDAAIMLCKLNKSL